MKPIIPCQRTTKPHGGLLKTLYENIFVYQSPRLKGGGFLGFGNQKELEMKTIDRHQKDFAREFDGANNQMKMYLDEIDRQREAEEKSRKLGR